MFILLSNIACIFISKFSTLHVCHKMAGNKKAARRRLEKDVMSLLLGETKIIVRALCLEQKIGVCVERNGWAHSFVIRVKDGLMPPGYEGDLEIMVAYREVRAFFEKSQRKQSSPSTGDTARG